jgi:hypothetical protein
MLQMMQIIVYIQFSIVHPRRLWIIEGLIDAGIGLLYCCIAGATLLWTVILDGRFGRILCVIIIVTFGAERWTCGRVGDLGLFAIYNGLRRVSFAIENFTYNHTTHFWQPNPDVSCPNRSNNG